MEEPEIRTANTEDVAAIAELWIEFMDFHYERDPWFKRAESGHEAFAEFVGKRVEDPDSVVLVAVVDGKIAAYALMNYTQRLPVFNPETCAGIMDLAVTASHRRAGLGTKMVYELLRLARARGATTVEVSFTLSNEASTAFWRKMGFSPYLQKSRLQLSKS